MKGRKKQRHKEEMKERDEVGSPGKETAPYLKITIHCHGLWAF
jgi:hypothetical protein